MALHCIMVGSGLLTKDVGKAPYGPPRDNNRQKFYDYMHESKDMFVVIDTPRVKDWKTFLADYPDFAKKFIHFEMPYAVTNALHTEDHKWPSAAVDGLTDSRRTKLIILKGGKCED